MVGHKQRSSKEQQEEPVPSFCEMVDILNVQLSNVHGVVIEHLSI